MPSSSAPILDRMADPRHPRSRFDEAELTAAVTTGAERWLTELRLAMFGIVISVGIGAADIGLQTGRMGGRACRGSWECRHSPRHPVGSPADSAQQPVIGPKEPSRH